MQLTTPTVRNNMEEWMCIKCRILIRPPIWKCQFGHVVCDKCNIHQDHTLKSSERIKYCKDTSFHKDVSLDKKLVKEFGYVHCQYHCGKRAEVSKIGFHEIYCKTASGSYKCYICHHSDWFLGIGRLLRHVRTKHPEEFADLTDHKATVEVDAQKSSYLIIRYNVFLYWVIHHRQIDPSSSSNSILVLYIGAIRKENQENQSLTEYSISSVSNLKLCVKDNVVIPKDFRIEEAVFSFLTLESGSCLSALEGDKYLVSFVNPSLLSLISMEFYCFVCLEVLYPPMKLCSVGHTICAKCASFLKSCPMCDTKIMNARNYALESIVDHTMDLTRKRKPMSFLSSEKKMLLVWSIGTSYILYHRLGSIDL